MAGSLQRLQLETRGAVEALGDAGTAPWKVFVRLDESTLFLTDALAALGRQVVTPLHLHLSSSPLRFPLLVYSPLCSPFLFPLLLCSPLCPLLSQLPSPLSALLSSLSSPSPLLSSLIQTAAAAAPLLLRPLDVVYTRGGAAQSGPNLDASFGFLAKQVRHSAPHAPLQVMMPHFSLLGRDTTWFTPSPLGFLAKQLFLHPTCCARKRGKPVGGAATGPKHLFDAATLTLLSTAENEGAGAIAIIRPLLPRATAGLTPDVDAATMRRRYVLYGRVLARALLTGAPVPQAHLHEFAYIFLLGREEEALGDAQTALRLLRSWDDAAASRLGSTEFATTEFATTDTTDTTDTIAAAEAAQLECRALLLESRRPQLEALREGFRAYAALPVPAGARAAAAMLAGWEPRELQRQIQG